MRRPRSCGVGVPASGRGWRFLARALTGRTVAVGDASALAQALTSPPPPGARDLVQREFALDVCVRGFLQCYTRSSPERRRVGAGLSPVPVLRPGRRGIDERLLTYCIGCSGWRSAGRLSAVLLAPRSARAAGAAWPCGSSSCYRGVLAPSAPVDATRPASSASGCAPGLTARCTASRFRWLAACVALACGARVVGLGSDRAMASACERRPGHAARCERRGRRCTAPGHATGGDRHSN